jgi:hypothetical protein
MPSRFLNKLYPAFAAILLLSGCGGGGGSDAPGSSLAGSWYSEAEDLYLVIPAEGSSAAMLACSSTGYKPVPNATYALDGDTLVATSPFSETPVTIRLQRNGNTLSASDGESTLELALRLAVPPTCSGDYVEILSLTPDTAVTGSQTQFTFNLSYRLASQSSAQIHVGGYFNPIEIDDNGVQRDALVVQQGSASVTMTGTFTTAADPAPGTFWVAVSMSDIPLPLDGGPPLASEIRLVPLTAATTGAAAPQKAQATHQPACHLRLMGLLGRPCATRPPAAAR